MPKPTRRDFLATASAGVAASTLFSTVKSSAAGANERSRPFPKSRRMAHRSGRQAGPRGTAAGRPPAQGRQPTKPRKRPGKASTWRKAGRRGSSG